MCIASIFRWMSWRSASCVVAKDFCSASGAKAARRVSEMHSLTSSVPCATRTHYKNVLSVHSDKIH